jgi:hypothetical protein
MGIRQVAPSGFLTGRYDRAVFTQLGSEHYVARRDGSAYSKPDFYANPHLYRSAFAPFAEAADIMVNGIYWDSRSPAFFTVADMASPRFRIQVIADVTCDIAPASSIPSTVRASTIADPVFGFDPRTGAEAPPHRPGCIDMMTIDNLPNEMPRDASEAFGKMFLQHIMPELLKPSSAVIEGGTIAESGKLTPRFSHLEDYAAHGELHGIVA